VNVPVREGISRIQILEYWLPLLSWLVVVYLFSTDRFSFGETSRIIVPILKFLFPFAPPNAIALLHAGVRKAGHVTEYFVLGALAYRVFHFDHVSSTRAKATTFLFVMTAALSDEAHQMFTASRTASLLDVGYDLSGAVLAIWLLSRRKTQAVPERAYSFRIGQ
jgi:VanZ family protein